MHVQQEKFLAALYIPVPVRGKEGEGEKGAKRGAAAHRNPQLSAAERASGV